jgi:hypothetical protein
MVNLCRVQPSAHVWPQQGAGVPVTGQIVSREPPVSGSPPFQTRILSSSAKAAGPLTAPTVSAPSHNPFGSSNGTTKQQNGEALAGGPAAADDGGAASAAVDGLQTSSAESPPQGVGAAQPPQASQPPLQALQPPPMMPGLGSGTNPLQVRSGSLAFQPRALSAHCADAGEMQDCSDLQTNTNPFSR